MELDVAYTILPKDCDVTITTQLLYDVITRIYAETP